MRRFSQRNHLVTLSDINITPLLDLAFVLLIIFIITTPLLEQGLEIKLPQGGKPDKPFNKDDIQTLELGRDGTIMLNRHRVTFEQAEAELASMRRANPNLAVMFRADSRDTVANAYKAINMLSRLDIKVNWRGALPEGK